MATPKELPGFYYDLTKKRYFPGKRPPASSTSTPSTTLVRPEGTVDTQVAHQKHSRRGSTYQHLVKLKSNPFAYGARRRFHTYGPSILIKIVLVE